MIYALVGLAVIAAVAWLMLRKHGAQRATVGWSAGPDGYSAGVAVDITGSFDFPQSPASVHYVTKAGSLAGKSKIVMRYRIEEWYADPGVKFVPSSDPLAPSIGPTLYFQRADDDWSGQGKFEAYRWWATFAAPTPIMPGEFEIVALLTGHWTAIETSNADDDPEAFRAALTNSARVGFTFGGGTGYGHGVYATGKARFTLLSFEVA